MNRLDDSPYQGYLYAYPHKTAYRPLRPRPSLREVWSAERRDALYLYLHLPFCEMRCGFCNLFTRANPPAEQVSAYLAQLRRQAGRVRSALDSVPGPAARFARVAVGGGTPTYLSPAELTAMFDLIEVLGAEPGRVPTAVETSPATATRDRIAVLAERGTTRVSIGVQSFLDAEARLVGRPQRRAEVERALENIRDQRIPVLNIDLIYGIPGQTPDSWHRSLGAALRWRPEELFLYPLYVRPLTGLARRAAVPRQRPAAGPTAPPPAAVAPAPAAGDPGWDGQRLALYRQGREVLLRAGYRQLSMRHFRRVDLPETGDPDYCCQDDGMVGLGCGARSYTTDLHYSFDYAVGVRQVRAIIDDYLTRPAADFDHAEVGFRLDRVEQRRRWLVKSLLRTDGLDPGAYRARFGTEARDDFPALDVLGARGWLDTRPGRIALTPAGLERSDAIGPWLVSGQVRAAMTEYAVR
ncbi:STM4012 family radical SAM protein [Micromonospora sp. NPDC049559]|uniref:STM4012 family radical SAM protein n=1 Tax=Micromonospora sp. NPDC049559 TaxID=3155923 RepID=UPI003447390A